MKPSAFSQKPGMPSPAKRRESFNRAQPDLFNEAPRHYADLDVGAELLGAVKRSLRLARQRGLSVDHVCAEMNKLLPRERHITPRQLYAWCAESREQHRFPAEYIPAFAAATNCNATVMVIADALGFALVDERELSMTRLGENVIRRARLAREERELKRRLDQ